jgi:hypothetical protein
MTPAAVSGPAPPPSPSVDLALLAAQLQTLAEEMGRLRQGLDRLVAISEADKRLGPCSAGSDQINSARGLDPTLAVGVKTGLCSARAEGADQAKGRALWVQERLLWEAQALLGEMMAGSKPGFAGTFAKPGTSAAPCKKSQNAAEEAAAAAAGSIRTDATGVEMELAGTGISSLSLHRTSVFVSEGDLVLNDMRANSPCKVSPLPLQRETPSSLSGSLPPRSDIWPAQFPADSRFSPSLPSIVPLPAKHAVPVPGPASQRADSCCLDANRETDALGGGEHSCHNGEARGSGWEGPGPAFSPHSADQRSCLQLQLWPGGPGPGVELNLPMSLAASQTRTAVQARQAPLSGAGQREPDTLQNVLPHLSSAATITVAALGMESAATATRYCI